MDLTEFWTVCSGNSIVLEKDQLDRFSRFHDELLHWNKKVNLISRKDEENIYQKHILHSLALFKYLEPFPKAKCIDIGTGGGLPGIPLKIALEDIDMTLIDSIDKKVKINKMLADHTGLENIRAIKGRAELLKENKSNHNRYDFILARAVAPIKKIVAWSREILKPGGKYLLLKGGDLSSEIDEAKNTFKELEVKVDEISMFGSEWMKRDQKKVVICEIS